MWFGLFQSDAVAASVLYVLRVCTRRSYVRYVNVLIVASDFYVCVSAHIFLHDRYIFVWCWWENGSQYAVCRESIFLLRNVFNFPQVAGKEIIIWSFEKQFCSSFIETTFFGYSVCVCKLLQRSNAIRESDPWIYFNLTTHGNTYSFCIFIIFVP